MNESTEGSGSDSTREDLPVRRAKKVDAWSGRVTQDIGKQLKHWRRELDMTAQELSDATEVLGQRVPRSVITNIENDRRDYVSVAELLLLAGALSVPPILLIAPIGREHEVEPLPDVSLSPWRTRGWFMGALAPRYEGFDLEAWNETSIAIKLYDKHRLLVRSYQEAVHRLQELDGDHMEIYPGREWPQDKLDERRRFRSLMHRQIIGFLEQIRRHREDMQSLGIVPPELPADVETDLSSVSQG
jgi:transcriptional regulator with XRE-family HTH domain